MVEAAPKPPGSTDAAAAERLDEGLVTGGVGVVVGCTTDLVERRDPVGEGGGGDALTSAAGDARVLIGARGAASSAAPLASPPRLDLRRDFEVEAAASGSA